MCTSVVISKALISCAKRCRHEHCTRHCLSLPSQVPYYLGSAWKGRAELSASADEARVISMQPQPALPERMHRQLSIAAHLATDKSLELFLYAPYWVINKTGLPLQIRVCLAC